MRPYSNDLRQRVCEGYENKQGSYRSLAERFMVSPSFVQDIVRLYRETGSVSPKPHGGGAVPKIGGNRIGIVRELCEKSPDSALKELCQEFYGKTGIAVSQSVMHNALKKPGLTFKKKLCGRLNRTEMI